MPNPSMPQLLTAAMAACQSELGLHAFRSPEPGLMITFVGTCAHIPPMTSLR